MARFSRGASQHTGKPLPGRLRVLRGGTGHPGGEAGELERVSLAGSWRWAVVKVIARLLGQDSGLSHTRQRAQQEDESDDENGDREEEE